MWGVVGDVGRWESCSGTLSRLLASSTELSSAAVLPKKVLAPCYRVGVGVRVRVRPSVVARSRARARVRTRVRARGDVSTGGLHDGFDLAVGDAPADWGRCH